MERPPRDGLPVLMMVDQKGKSMKNYILHAKSGNILISEADAIAEARKQEKSGVAPAFSWRDYKTGEKVTPPGWLVWSTYEDGCGVVYRRSDGKMVLVTGWQGDFSCD